MRSRAIRIGPRHASARIDPAAPLFFFLAIHDGSSLPEEILNDSTITLYTSVHGIGVPARSGYLRRQSRKGTPGTTPGTEETDPIGIVGNTYKPIQNEEHAELLNLLVDESGAHFNSAGSTTNGSRVFISMKLPNTIQIGGEDAVDFNIVAFNSHDGSSTFKLAVTPLRVVCSNMQNAALRGNKRTFSIRHTAAAEGNIVLAREALGMTFAYMDEFQSAMEQMMATEISDRNARKVLENVFAVGDSETDRQEKRRLSTVEDVMQVYREAPTNENIKGSTYGSMESF